jgi:gluconate 2-dehydrogenase gamma chain
MANAKYPTGSVRSLLDTDLMTEQTRLVIQSRLAPEDTAPNDATPSTVTSDDTAHVDASTPRFFDAESFATLKAACARLIPQNDREHPVDLAGAIDVRLAEGKSNGWRYDDMPHDGEAHKRGILGLDESAQLMFSKVFRELDQTSQDKILLAVQRGEARGETWRTIPAKHFFEEMLAEVTECYYSDPLTQEEIGYVGMADAKGWQRIGLNELESHEPRPLSLTS